jgi:glycosyltransferase involved in cell wall biosynthesis
VIDDSSSDRTPEVVRQFAKTTPIPVVLLRQEQALGANAARNLGLQEARGEIITFMDDDVIVPPDWLEKLLNGLLKSGCAAVSGAVRLTVDGPIVGKHRGEVGAVLSEILEAPRGVNSKTVPVACNMAAFRCAFERARFDEAVRPPMEENDWMERAGVTAAFLPEAWVWHYKTPEELCLKRVLPLAWRRGGEGGRWMRERLKISSRRRLPMVAQSLSTSVRAFGHAAWQRCWGGVVVGFGELSRALALAGLINRGPRVPGSWR